MNQYKYKKFMEIDYGEISPEVKNNKILDEPLKFPDRLTSEWREWITSQQTINLNNLHKNDPIENLKVENTTIRNGQYSTPVRIYTPTGDGPFPIIIYIHGGAWVFCDLNTHDHDCRYLSANSECIVISVDYHLAPEYKFPYQIKECAAVLEWVSQNADKVNGIPGEIVIGGDSAGGNITAGLCIYNRDNNGPKIKKQILIYPATDLYSNQYYSYERYGQGYGLNKDSNEFNLAYVENEEDLKNPCVSPVLCKDLKGLPPALFISGECDILVDGALVYAQLLKESGVDVECFVYKGMPHGFIQAIYDEAYEALDQICKDIKHTFNSK